MTETLSEIKSNLVPEKNIFIHSTQNDLSV